MVVGGKSATKKTNQNCQLKLDICYDLANKSSVWIYWNIVCNAEYLCKHLDCNVKYWPFPYLRTNDAYLTVNGVFCDFLIITICYFIQRIGWAHRIYIKYMKYIFSNTDINDKFRSNYLSSESILFLYYT